MSNINGHEISPQQRYRHILRNLAPVCQHMGNYNGPNVAGACDEAIKRLQSDIQHLRRLKNAIIREDIKV